jgi:hypothetical protein
VGHSLLEEIAHAGRVVAEQVDGVARFDVLGEDQHREARMIAAETEGGDEPFGGVRRWHSHVDDGEVRVEGGDRFEQLCRITRLGHDREARLGEQSGESFAEEDGVVGEDDPYGHCLTAAMGSRTVTAVP